MPRSLDDINLDDLTLGHLLEFDLTTFGSIPPQPFCACQSPTVADTSMAPAYQPRYNPYEESLTPLGGHFAPTAPPTYRRQDDGKTPSLTHLHPSQPAAKDGQLTGSSPTS